MGMFGILITQFVASVSAVYRGGARGSKLDQNAIRMHNIGFDAKFLDADNMPLAYDNGVALFEEMRDIVDELCCTESICDLSKEYDTLNCYAFRVISVKLPDDNPLYKQRLYFYFDQQRTLVPPFAYKEYNEAFESGDLDKCYRILNSVFGKISCEEAAYLGAYAVRERFIKNKGRGILFLDTISGKMFFLGREKNAARGGKKSVLIIPNGFLNIYKFLTYSLNLIEKMVAQSEYASKINEVYYGLIGIKGCSGDSVGLNVEICETPVCKLLAYKFFVYNVLSMEVCGVGRDAIIDWINQSKGIMFVKVGKSSLRVKVDVEFM